MNDQLLIMVTDRSNVINSDQVLIINNYGVVDS